MTASRVLIVAGKGGVGKTTLGATLGLAAAGLGLDVALVELEGHSSLGPLLGTEPLGHEPRRVEVAVAGSSSPPGTLTARRLLPDEALIEYLGRHGLGRIAARLIRSGAVEVAATGAPGVRDLLVLGKIRQLEQARLADLIVVDAPAAGHAVTFLRAPAGMADSSPSGPLHEQASLALDLLGDETRCRTMLVTLPEETPINEAVETAFTLEDEVGVKLTPIVVNGCWPATDALAQELAATTATWRSHHPVATEAADFALAQRQRQQAECARLARELPLAQVHLDHQFTTRLHWEHLIELSLQLRAGLDRLGSP